MFPVRPTYRLGESLSSWRQRIALANGFLRFPRQPHEHTVLDADLSPDASSLHWTAQLSNIDVEALTAMTLRALDRTLLIFGKGRACPRWVLPLRYSARSRPNAVGYCPLCLRTDSEPYFRLIWRFAFVCSCPKHGCLLRTSCPHCGSSVWPQSAMSPKNCRWGDPLSMCQACRKDLCWGVECVLRSPEPEVELLLPRAKYIQIAKEVNVRAWEYLAVLRELCGLFIRREPRERMENSGCEFVRSALTICAEAASTKTIEEVPLEARADLLTVGHGLLRNWPQEFLDFCDLSEIGAYHFSGDRPLLPAWFLEVLDENVRRHRRVSKESFEVVKLRLRLTGREITKASIASELGISNSRRLDNLLRRRAGASSDELELLCKNLTCYMHVPTSRKSTREMHARDAALIALAICTSTELVEVTSWDWHQVATALASADGARFSGPLAAVLLAAMRNFLRLRAQKHSKRSRSRSRVFESYRGGEVPYWSVQKTLRICMASHDPNLWRKVNVFFPSGCSLR